MKDQLDNDIDALFKLPLAEFTSARNMLATELKKGGRHNEAERVKLLAKPSVSAWAVNQLYWQHRQAFDQLIATGKRFGRGQKLRLVGKVANMRESLDARREALSRLSDLATALLRDAGHNPTLDTMRRIATTLEAISAYALLPDGPTPGRLTQDVDPPSFESLASLMSGAGQAEPARLRSGVTQSTRQKATDETRQLQEAHRAKIAVAKLSLQQKKRSLSEARATAESLEGAQKKANAEAKEAEKYRREAEELLKKASAASEDAAQRARSVAAEAEEASQALEEAKRMVADATKELESLLRESP